MKNEIQKSGYGRLGDGVEVDLYTLRNRHGINCKIINYGGIITALELPDRQGKLADVVLGFDRLEGYAAKHPFFGALVGRVANRIAQGRFTLDGQVHTLATNNGPNHLHGGLRGFDKVVWEAEPSTAADGVSLRLTHTSPDGDEGYPGALKVSVTYTLNERDELCLEYEATTDKPTPVNLTNHSYFNLAGAGDILDHVVTIAADFFTPSDTALLPTGEIKPVLGTPFDFNSPTAVGSRFNQLENNPRGYDHNFVLRGGVGRVAFAAPVVEPKGQRVHIHLSSRLAFAARVVEPQSGRVLEVFTDQPGMQFYTGNSLNGSVIGKAGVACKQHAALCLETQHFPDSVNHPNFPSIILRPGQTYRQSTVFRFSTE